MWNIDMPNVSLSTAIQIIAWMAVFRSMICLGTNDNLLLMCLSAKGIVAYSVCCYENKQAAQNARKPTTLIVQGDFSTPWRSHLDHKQLGRARHRQTRNAETRTLFTRHTFN